MEIPRTYDVAYFISPSGDITEVTEHIDYVSLNPEKFGFIKKELEDLKECQGVMYREYVLANVLRKGWIRIRFDCKHDVFSIQIGALSGDMVKYITEFVITLLNNKCYHTSIRVTDYKGFSYLPVTEANAYICDRTYLYDLYMVNGFGEGHLTNMLGSEKPRW